MWTTVRAKEQWAWHLQEKLKPGTQQMKRRFFNVASVIKSNKSNPTDK